MGTGLLRWYANGQTATAVWPFMTHCVWLEKASPGSEDRVLPILLHRRSLDSRRLFFDMIVNPPEQTERGLDIMGLPCSRSAVECSFPGETVRSLKEMIVCELERANIVVRKGVSCFVCVILKGIHQAIVNDRIGLLRGRFPMPELIFHGDAGNIR